MKFLLTNSKQTVKTFQFRENRWPPQGIGRLLPGACSVTAITPAVSHESAGFSLAIYGYENRFLLVGMVSSEGSGGAT